VTLGCTVLIASGVSVIRSCSLTSSAPFPLRRIGRLIALTLVVTACSESPSLPVPETPTMVQGLVSDEDPPLGTRCHEGFCTGDEDPFPDSAGVWISNTVTDDLCFGGGTNDIDQDGLSDFCENNLAEAFAPELVLASALNDPATREPRWAARPIGPDRLMIIYLLSYHHDYGTVHAACYLAPVQILYPNACNAHPGDSETIVLFIEYRPNTQHWLLTGARYSAHHGYNSYDGQGSYPKRLEYPDRVGGRPRSYVAVGKHANYATAADCNAGGTLGIDSCSVDRFEVVQTGASRNLGSNHVRFANCVGSSHPVFGPLGHQECYWTGATFHGWTGAIGFPEPTSGYMERLSQWFFIN